MMLAELPVPTNAIAPPLVVSDELVRLIPPPALKLMAVPEVAVEVIFAPELVLITPVVLLVAVRLFVPKVCTPAKVMLPLLLRKVIGALQVIAFTVSRPLSPLVLELSPVIPALLPMVRLPAVVAVKRLAGSDKVPVPDPTPMVVVEV